MPGGPIVKGFPSGRLIAAEFLAGFAAHLQHLAPQAVLGRGYAIVRDADGRILRSSHGLQPGAALGVELAEGGLDVRVTTIRE